MSAALHQAGHAAVDALLNGACRDVRPLRGDCDGQHSGTTGRSYAVVPVLLASGDPALRRLGLAEAADWATITFAGQAAAAVGQGDPLDRSWLVASILDTDPDLLSPDDRVVRRIADHLFLSGSSTAEVFHLLVGSCRRANQIVHEWWESVAAMAHLLEDGGTVQGEQLLHLLFRTSQPCWDS